MGHKDARPGEGNEESPNLVILNLFPASTDVHTIGYGEMTEEVRDEVCALCDYFVGQCLLRLDPVIKRCLPAIRKHPVGTYKLCLTEPPHDWIKPFDNFEARFEE
jgi:hypothetical protein